MKKIKKKKIKKKKVEKKKVEKKKVKNIVEFNPIAILIKRKIAEVVKKYNPVAEECSMKPIADSVVKNANHFTDKITEVFVHYKIPEIDRLWDGCVSFLWDFSIQPIKQLELYIYANTVTVIAEDKLENIKAYKEVTFYLKVKKFPKS